jgi:HK97 family phage portal protein
MSQAHIDDFFGSEIATKKRSEKGWSEDWLRMKESNILSLSQNQVTDPYSQSAVVYRAVRAIAENLPQAVFRIFEGDQEVPLTHPLQRLFNKPNKFMSRWELWESIATYLNIGGEAFIYLNESMGQRIGSSSVPAELWSLNPSLMKHTVEKGQVAGWVFNNTLPIKPEEIIHIKLFNPNNAIRGQSPISAVRTEIESDFSAGRYNKIFFDNGASPNGVVAVDKDKDITLEELKKLKRLWNENHAGVGNAHKTAFLLGGMSYSQMAISQKDAEFIQGREFSRTQILSVFGVPKFVAGYGDKGEVNRSTAAAAKNLFWTATITPQLRRIEEKFLSDFFMMFAPGFVGKFDLSGIPELRPDLGESLEAGNKMFSMGWTRNEINHRLQLDMPTDPDGDIRYIPSNFLESGDSEDAEPAKAAPEPIEKAEVEMSKGIIDGVIKQRRQAHLRTQAKLERKLHKKIKRYLFRVRSDSLKAVEGEAPGNITRKLKGILDNSKEDLVKLIEPIFREIMQQGADTAIANLGTERMLHGIEHKQTETVIDEAVLIARANKITGISDTIFDQLNASIGEALNNLETIPEIATRTKEVFNMATNRSIVIARTESNSLLNGSATATYEKEGVQSKEWLTTMDDKARESHQEINGQIVPIGANFSNGLQYPGADGPAEEVVNCRCAISPVIIEG